MGSGVGVIVGVGVTVTFGGMIGATCGGCCCLTMNSDKKMSMSPETIAKTAHQEAVLRCLGE